MNQSMKSTKSMRKSIGRSGRTRAMENAVQPLQARQPRLSRPAPWWRILLVWARQEFMLLLREPVAVFFSLAFPLIIYVFIGIPYGSTEIAPGVHFIDAMFSSLILTVAANLLLMGLPIYLAELRSCGVDRRYAVLPLPGRLFASSVLASMLILLAGSSAVIVLVVGLRDGLRATLWSPVYLLLLIGSILWLSALGFLIGALRVSARTTQALSAAIFFIMFFGSGAAVPLEGLPEILQKILEWNPLKQWLDVMIGVYTGAGASRTEWLRLLLALPMSAICALGGLRLWRQRS